MVGNELKPTQGKPGDTGASSFPSASHPQPPALPPACVASASGSIFARFFTLVPRSLLGNRTETLASAVKSPLFFFPRQFFARALQSWKPGTTGNPGALLYYPTSARSLGSCLCLLFCLFVCFYWFLSHFTFRVSSPIRITLECKEIVPFSSRQSPL